MGVALSDLARTIKTGIYRHYKGNLYEVIGVGKLENNLQDVVIYRSCVHPDEIWVRSVTDFLETVDYEGKNIPRFILIRHLMQ